MDAILHYYTSSNYTPIGSSLLALLGVFVLIFKKNLPSRLLIFKYYFIGYVLITLGGAICYALKTKLFFFPLHIVDQFIDYAFTIFEFYVIAFYLKPYLSTKLFRVGSIIFYIISSILFYLGFLAETVKNYFYLQTIFNLQAAIILTFCYDYFRKFINPNTTQLQLSSFSIVTWISILMLGTLPFTLVSHHLLLTKHPNFGDLFSIVYVLYMIMFSVLIIGILSHKPGTNSLKSENISFNKSSL